MSGYTDLSAFIRAWNICHDLKNIFAEKFGEKMAKMAFFAQIAAIF
jgi:hypothetical protein